MGLTGQIVTLSLDPQFVSKKWNGRSTWLAQSEEHMTIDLSQDREFKAYGGSTDNKNE